MHNQYPNAFWHAAASGNFRMPMPPRVANNINLIVIHITDGSASEALWTARWFANPNQKNLQGKPIHVSAHYVVGRRGEIYQCVKHEHIANHAGSANARSIGIEHVVPRNLNNLTTDQYDSSAELVKWLGQELSIPIDEAHVRGHADVSAGTKHKNCPRRAFDWDEFWRRFIPSNISPIHAD